MKKRKFEELIKKGRKPKKVKVKIYVAKPKRRLDLGDIVFIIAGAFGILMLSSMGIFGKIMICIIGGAWAFNFKRRLELEDA